jgi:hypothetical protein
LQPPPYAVITNCTSRKRRTKGPVVSVAALATTASVSEGARRWLQLVRDARSTHRVEDLYVGRAFADARAAATTIGASLHVVSAGLGLVASYQRAPIYDLSVADRSHSSIRPRLGAWGATPADWWEALAAARGVTAPVASLIDRCASTTFLIALPSAYISLVNSDLASLETGASNRVRIFTSTFGAKAVPANLRNSVMPYDDRLESSRWSGTRADFPQRALRHFVEELVAVGLPSTEAASRVRAAMRALVLRSLPLRHRKDDREIREILSRHWDRFEGSSSKLLRFLRDDVLVSCEQSRFRSIWLSIRGRERATRSDA